MAAKNWIAYHESSYNYRAVNGNCYGRYHHKILSTWQLISSQSGKSGYPYVKGRYGFGQKPSINKVTLVLIKNPAKLLVTEMFFICKETAVSMTAALVLSLVYSGMVLG